MSLSQIKSIIKFRQSAEPTSKEVGDVWLNTRTQVVKTWNGTTWDLNWKGYGMYGYSIGGTDGSVFLSSVERFNFPFNAGYAHQVGSLSENLVTGSAVNSSSHAHAAGLSQAGVTLSLTNVFSFEFPFDTGSSSHTYNLNYSGKLSASCNSSEHGFFMGGTPATYTSYSSIDRITFSTGSGTASHVGNLSSSRRASGGCNSSNYGFSLGGTNSTSPDHAGLNEVDRIAFPFNSGTSSSVGFITEFRSQGSCLNSSEHGFYCAGWQEISSFPVYFSYIERMSFPFNSGSAVLNGFISTEGWNTAGCNSSRYGYISGGFNGAIKYSNIERFTFPFNSGISSPVGVLSGSKYNNIGIDECDFINQFV